MCDTIGLTDFVSQAESVTPILWRRTGLSRGDPSHRETKEGKLQIDYSMINASFRDTNDLLSSSVPAVHKYCS